MSFPFNQEIVWQPNPDWIAASNINRFLKIHNLHDYDSLLQKSVEDSDWFWEAVLTDLDIQFYQHYDQILDQSKGIQFPEWCKNGKMNIIHNCLDKWLSTPTADRIALRWEGEEGSIKALTYRQLYSEVNKCANAMLHLGLTKGDVIGLYMPMIPELAVAFLAVIKIGAIILPLFSGYGPGAIETRMSDAGAKAIITVDGGWRRGKKVQLKINADRAAANLSELCHMIVVNRLNLNDIPWQEGRDYWWHELVETQQDAHDTFQTGAEDVLMLIYTSGTTGKPKGAVHTHCGFPVKAAQDMFYCMDLKPGETMYWMTDIGWMMGPWEIFGTLMIGAAMVFYDGAPDYPDHTRLWQQIEAHRITHLGVSPTLIRTLKQHGTKSLVNHNFSGLRMIGSTGSPWDPETWMWLFEHVLEKKKPILNYSGGTEISGGIVCGNFFKPLKPCAFSGPIPGMAADVIDDSGQSVQEQVGELVIRKPWIGMTRGFWKDNQRYLETYWNRFPDIWVHGDFAAIDADGLWYILGRSDDTIKVSGKRIGPAEVESILNAHPAVSESAVIGVPHDIKGEEIVAFCVLNTNQKATTSLRQDLVHLITEQLGKPLKPHEVKFCANLPKTRNAKVMHRIIRAAYLGKDPGDISSLEDPAAVDNIRDAV